MPAYAAALLLHPSRRRRYIDINWKRSWIKSVLPKLQKLWEENYATIEDVPSSLELMQEPDEYELLERDLDVLKLTTVGKDEWEAFIEASPIEITTTALKWWCQ